MSIGKEEYPAQKSVAPAMALIVVGLMLVVLGASSTALGWHDFIRGLATGMGIALELIGVVLAVRAVHWKSELS